MKFPSSVAGQITALKFYRSASDTGTDLLRPVERDRHQARQRHLHQHRRQRLADRHPADPGHDRCQHDLCRLLPHDRRLCGDQQLLHQRRHQRAADGAVQRDRRRQRRLCLWRHRTAGIFPTNTFGASNYCADVVFVRRDDGSEHRADGGRRYGQRHREGRHRQRLRRLVGRPATSSPTTPIPTRATPRPSPRSASARRPERSARRSPARMAASSSMPPAAFTYTVNETDAAVQALRQSTNTLTDVFNYTMRDAAGATSSTTLTVTIHGANDAPVLAVQTGNQSATVGSAFSLRASGRHVHRRRCGRYPDLRRDRRRRFAAAGLARLQRRDTDLQRHAGGGQCRHARRQGDAPPISARLATSETFNIAVSATPNAAPTAVADTADRHREGRHRQRLRRLVADRQRPHQRHRSRRGRHQDRHRGEVRQRRTAPSARRSPAPTAASSSMPPARSPTR